MPLLGTLGARREEKPPRVGAPGQERSSWQALAFPATCVGTVDIGPVTSTALPADVT